MADKRRRQRPGSGTTALLDFAPPLPLPDAARRPRRIVSAEPSAALKTLLAVLGALAILAPALLVHFAPPVRPHPRARRVVTHVIPPTELPPVEPVRYQDLDPDDARAVNALVPFTSAPVPPARPFKLIAPPLDRERAIDCLATAVLYEAGDDVVGERAVAQVVLNRLRHPAFPKTVCGVVFEGSERSTGCQFSFTCDGAMIRHAWSAEAWGRARLIAQAALNGGVFAKVGYATHYHTDWVVPYWSASLDKVSAVGTHLFYRWTGWWGTPGAFSRSASGSEPVIPALAMLYPAHRADGAVGLDGMGAAFDPPPESLPQPVAGDPASFLVTIDAGTTVDQLARLAVHSCGERSYCKFMAWTSRAETPRRLPIDGAAMRTMAFAYLRDHDRLFDKMLWNCRIYPRPIPNQCMKRQLPQAEPLPPDPTPTTEAPNDLSGTPPPDNGTAPAKRLPD